MNQTQKKKKRKKEEEKKNLRNRIIKGQLKFLTQ